MFILPWHDSQWQVLQKRNKQHSLPHALLLTGPAGVGKQIFAERFARSLLCSNPTDDGCACGSCRNCVLIKAETHPDLLRISPDEEGKAIKVDMIRSLSDFVGQTSQFGKYKIIIIQPADAMNINAANALLKTLEEPNPRIIIMLITNRLMALPATVRSRCQIIPFPVPNKEVAVKWLSSKEIAHDKISLLLALSNGAPLKVVEMIEENKLEFRNEIFKQWINFVYGKEDLVSLAAKWHKLDLKFLLMHLASWIMDLIRIQQADENRVINVDVINVLKKLAIKYDSKKLYGFYDEINQTLHWLYGPVNLNPQLMLEGLLAHFLAAG